ncbi:MAG: septum formation initiator family protein [Pyrinomonadaceae bacterium]
MNKAENTYWDNTRTEYNTARPANPRKIQSKAIGLSSRSQFVGIGVAVLLTVMLVLTVNFRAFSVLNTEAAEAVVLNNKIQAVTGENLAIQEEIHYLKNDSDTIEREARKFGLSRPKKEKIPVPAK